MAMVGLQLSNVPKVILNNNELLKQGIVKTGNKIFLHFTPCDSLTTEVLVHPK